MKATAKSMAMAIALFCAMAAEPQAVAQPAPPPPPPGVHVGATATDGSGAPQQRRRRRKPLTPEQQMEKFGGFVEPAYGGKYLYFVDSQGRIPAEAVEWVAGQVRIALSLPTRIERNAKGAQGPAALPPDAGGMITVVDIEGEPSLLVAPDNGWARVNVAALASDGVSAEVLEARFKKELWRAFVILFGGGNSFNDFDVMRPIRAPKDLDACKALVSSPEPFNAVLTGAHQRVPKGHLGTCQGRQGARADEPDHHPSAEPEEVRTADSYKAHVPVVLCPLRPIRPQCPISP